MKDTAKKYRNAHVPPTESQPERVELRDLLADYDPSVLRQWLEEQERVERDQELPEQGRLK